ncbi:MFS transporter [Cytobacillus sp. IB215665]|uniref:MFS transporter n=1 Tax=Cytobacillus sp. IB215665 TaxID=3097357 RepID=UPI002A0EB09E|nr:MFS transporter [Cytobacillus sp. IB215665]MDX8367472.1 MFS transporter [Cytobacillus sp. IB215665]
MELLMKRNINVQWYFVLFYFFVFFGIGSLYPLLGVYLKDDIGLTGTQIGVIMSISPVVMIVIQPMWGMLSDYTQKPRQLLTLAIVLTGVVGIVYSYASSYIMFIIIAALLAVMQSAIVPISDSMTLTYTERYRKNYGSIRLWGAIGFAFSVFIVGKLADIYGLGVIFFAFAIILFISALFAIKLPNESQSMKVNLRAGLSQLIRLRRFVLFLLTTFLIFGPIHANNTYFGILITEMGGSTGQVGMAFLLAAGSEAPFMLFAGRWIKRIGILQVLLFASFVSGARWLFYFFEPSLAVIYATTIAQGISVGFFIPAALQYVRDIAPSKVRATAISLYSAAGIGLGSWFCNFFGGVILERFSINNVYLFFSLLTVVGLITLLFVIIIDNKRRTVS